MCVCPNYNEFNFKFTKRKKNFKNSIKRKDTCGASLTSDGIILTEHENSDQPQTAIKI